MSNIEKALNILSYYTEVNYIYKSKLYDKDAKLVEKEYKTLFKKRKYNKLEITERLANQILNYNTIQIYKDGIDTFIKANSSKKDSFLIFDYEKKIDEEGYKAAKLLKNVCLKIINMYKNMLDTKDFDMAVGQVVKYFKENIERVPYGDYGVIFGYSIDNMPKIPKVEMEWLNNFHENISEILLNNSIKTKWQKNNLEPNK